MSQTFLVEEAYPRAQVRLRMYLYKTGDSYPPHVYHSTCVSLIHTNEHNTRLCTTDLYFFKIKQMRVETTIS